MCSRNAQGLHPISPLHQTLLDQPLAIQKAYLGKLGFPSFGSFMESDWARSLSAEGTSMLAIGNCANHSCDPNVFCSSGFPDFRAQFVALRDIREGEELCRSYIDETKSTAERRADLWKLYGFVCECPKCSI
mmetsp:Transcript_28388/g.79364  ORF Transcript_28388/g.79364 Transcript_28388/m.79364 type:complete len:132 (+) Transcript_28388:615-1010(+)